MKVIILPKYLFENNIDNIEKSDKKIFYASILEPDNTNTIRPDSENFKSFWFHDIDEDIVDEEKGIVYNKASDEQLNSIIDFVEENKAMDYFIVHCTAGISRSGAVGEFVNDFFGEEDYNTFKRNNPQIIPNTYIKNRLRELYELKES